MRESLMYGSVRGTRGNSRPYRDKLLLQCRRPLLALFVESLQCTISGAIGGAADMPRARRAHQSDVNDPNVWSGRALQEGFVDLADVRSCINVSGF
jgi:hypothetical protein